MLQFLGESDWFVEDKWKMDMQQKNESYSCESSTHPWKKYIIVCLPIEKNQRWPLAAACIPRHCLGYKNFVPFRHWRVFHYCQNKHCWCKVMCTTMENHLSNHVTNILIVQILKQWWILIQQVPLHHRLIISSKEGKYRLVRVTTFLASLPVTVICREMSEQQTACLTALWQHWWWNKAYFSNCLKRSTRCWGLWLLKYGLEAR